MKEKLKFIKNFKHYVISDQGNVYSFKHQKIRKLKLQLVSCTGYYSVRIRENNRYYMFNVHRLVIEHFHKDFNEVYIVNHLDGNKLNNKINNLEMCSQKANMIHYWNLIYNKVQ